MRAWASGVRRWPVSTRPTERMAQQRPTFPVKLTPTAAAVTRGRQPAVPAPSGAFEWFARGVAAAFAAPEVHLARATLLLPVYRVKWVCILLNEFLPVGGSRRAFAGSAAEQDARKANQLAKARAALAAVIPPRPTRKVA